jgi:hypothetical protein
MRLALMVIFVATALPVHVQADELDTLRTENATLRARLEELERENVELRGIARAAAPAIPTRVVERETPEGKKLWATEPSRIDVTGSRAVHWIWLERSPGVSNATLWIRGEFAGGIYQRTKQLTLRLDGSERTLPIASYDATRITTGVGHRPQRRDHEVVSVTLTPLILDALGGAATMSGQLGRTSFTVPTDVLASLRALARR